jgi:hypothetical protein
MALLPVIEASSINRIHLSRPEDGRRAIFRNVDFIYFIFYILFTIKTMDKVLEVSSSQYFIEVRDFDNVYLYRHGHRVFRSGFMLILC